MKHEREGEGREGTHKSICLRCGFGLQLVKNSLISLFMHLIQWISFNFELFASLAVADCGLRVSTFGFACQFWVTPRFMCSQPTTDTETETETEMERQRDRYVDR